MKIGCEGDTGDLVVLCGIIAELPDGPHEVLLQKSRVTKGGGIINNAAFVTDFVKSQPYIADCRPQKPGEVCDWNSGEFRGGRHHGKTESLMKAHLSHLKKTKGMGHGITGNNRWLHNIQPMATPEHPVVVNRTDRYRNSFFPWRRLVEWLGPKMVFVGLPHEHGAFCNDFGQIAYRPTSTLLEVAQIIAGSQLFIGNQSVANAIAEGLKHPMIQETSLEIPDCIYLRDNAQYVDTGRVLVPQIGDTPEALLKSSLMSQVGVSVHTTPPPGHWEYRGMKHSVFGELVRILEINQVQPEEGKSMEESVKLANVDRVPEFFMQDVIRSRFSNTERARQNAGYPQRTVREMIS